MSGLTIDTGVATVKLAAMPQQNPVPPADASADADASIEADVVAPTSADAGVGSGLRERKKERTRQQLRASAARLFAEHGFGGTTIADIAADADVSERTFFRYFDSKEALLLPDLAELFEFLEREVRSRPAEEPPFEAVRQALLAAAPRYNASSLTALKLPLAGTEPLVLAQLVQAFTGFEARLAELVLERLPADQADADLEAAVVAGAALSAVRAVLRTQRRRGRAGRDSFPADERPLVRALDILSRIGASQP